MAGKTVVVLGAGSGGLVASRSLRRHLPDADKVILVERSPVYRFAPSFLWILSGARSSAQVTADLGRVRRHGIDLMQGDVLGIDPAAGKVSTSDGDLTYDRLVISLGADIAPDALPGFAEAAHNVYTSGGADAGRRALEGFGGGRVAVLVSRLPYKCPAAPYETAFLAEASLRRHGVREHSTVDVYTPEPFPMPTAGPVMGKALESMLSARGIRLHPNVTVDHVDPRACEIVFTDGARSGYDLLLGIPPHRAPSAVRSSGLAAETGFVPVDRGTLATSAEGVFAIGDVTTIPIAGGKFLPKAGVFAHAQAEVVAARIANELRGRRPTAVFDGRGSCFVELGDGAAAFATGNFYAEDAPAISLRRPGRHWHLAKVAFEKYWMRRWL